LIPSGTVTLRSTPASVFTVRRPAEVAVIVPRNRFAAGAAAGACAGVLAKTGAANKLNPIMGIRSIERFGLRN
jgi:hypothetical protein